MVRVEVERKAILKDKTCFIDSTAHEELSKEEYMQMYQRKTQEINDLRIALGQGKNQLKEIEAIAMDSELAKFKEMLNKAEKLNKRDTLRSQLQEMEINLQTKEKELIQLTPIMKELNNG